MDTATDPTAAYRLSPYGMMHTVRHDIAAACPGCGVDPDQPCRDARWQIPPSIVHNLPVSDPDRYGHPDISPNGCAAALADLFPTD